MQYETDLAEVQLLDIMNLIDDGTLTKSERGTQFQLWTNLENTSGRPDKAMDSILWIVFC